MDRDTRNILNLKQPNLFSHGAVSIDGMSDGQITISKGSNQQTALSLKKDGRIYKTNMSSNGNQYVDKDLKVNGSINLSNKLIIKNYPAFYVYQSTSVDGQSIATGSTYTRIILDTEHYDNGSNFDVSGYKFTAPYNGIYHFDANLLMDSNVDTDAGDWDAEERLDIHLFKNQGDATTTSTTNRVASSLHLLSGAITDNFWQGNLSADLKLDAGDFIELYAKQDSGVEQHTHEPTGGDFTRFTGHLICAL
jgi:hypothetical protein